MNPAHPEPRWYEGRAALRFIAFVAVRPAGLTLVKGLISGCAAVTFKDPRDAPFVRMDVVLARCSGREDVPLHLATPFR